MIAHEEIVPTLERILADEAVLISKVKMMEPRRMFSIAPKKVITRR